MPKTIQDIKDFIELSKSATECRIKRKRDAVKIKLRTKNTLYVLKIEPNEAEEVIKKIKCQIIEM